MGFTILEVLVAFVIAALALSALTEGVASSVRSTAVAGHVQTALSIARSRLAVTCAARLSEHNMSGAEGNGFRWQVHVAQVDRELPHGPLLGRLDASTRDASDSVFLVLYSITVTVLWRMDGPDRQVQLETLRLGTDTGKGGPRVTQDP